jgi:hypothetical protein
MTFKTKARGKHSDLLTFKHLPQWVIAQGTNSGNGKYVKELAAIQIAGNRAL